MPKVTLATPMSESDSGEDMEVDTPPDIIDRNRKVCEKPDEECAVPLKHRERKIKKCLSYYWEFIKYKWFCIYVSVKIFGELKLFLSHMSLKPAIDEEDREEAVGEIRKVLFFLCEEWRKCGGKTMSVLRAVSKKVLKKSMSIFWV